MKSWLAPGHESQRKETCMSFSSTGLVEHSCGHEAFHEETSGRLLGARCPEGEIMRLKLTVMVVGPVKVAVEVASAVALEQNMGIRPRYCASCPGPIAQVLVRACDHQKLQKAHVIRV